MTTQSLYHRDFYAWALASAELVKAGRFDELDTDYLAEELESMGKREGRELNSRLKELVMHLLKWQYQPERRSRSWLTSINKQRISIDELLDENPSLRHELEDRLSHGYTYTRRYAALETGLPLAHFPELCPYSLQDVLAEGFLPGGTPLSDSEH